MTGEQFVSQVGAWMTEMRQVALDRPGTGACTLASSMDLWLWTLRHLRKAKDPDGRPLVSEARYAVTGPMAEALGWLMAARSQVLDVVRLEADGGPGNPGGADFVQFMSDLCHAQTARAASEVGRICAELVHGYNRHPAWDAGGAACCLAAADLAAFEQVIPGIESTAGSYEDVIEADGRHAAKAGPCVHFPGLDEFARLRAKLDACLTGSHLARARAAASLARVGLEAP